MHLLLILFKILWVNKDWIQHTNNYLTCCPLTEIPHVDHELTAVPSQKQQHTLRTRKCARVKFRFSERKLLTLLTYSHYIQYSHFAAPSFDALLRPVIYYCIWTVASCYHMSTQDRTRQSSYTHQCIMYNLHNSHKTHFALQTLEMINCFMFTIENFKWWWES